MQLYTTLLRPCTWTKNISSAQIMINIKFSRIMFLMEQVHKI